MDAIAFAIALPGLMAGLVIHAGMVGMMWVAPMRLPVRVAVHRPKCARKRHCGHAQHKQKDEHAFQYQHGFIYSEVFMPIPVCVGLRREDIV